MVGVLEEVGVKKGIFPPTGRKKEVSKKFFIHAAKMAQFLGYIWLEKAGKMYIT